jgi:3-mercaptopyruvate sulfurtransferase SseA
MKVMKVVNVLMVGGLLALLTLVLVKSFSYGHFRNDAAKWADPSINQSNLINPNRVNTLPGALVVDLSNKGDLLKNFHHTINIAAKSLLDKTNQKTLRSHKGAIVLVSDDPALSARMWMLMSQLGYRNLYILDDGEGNEVFKYKFRPDSLIGPEL